MKLNSAARTTAEMHRERISIINSPHPNFLPLARDGANRTAPRPIFSVLTRLWGWQTIALLILLSFDSRLQADAPCFFPQWNPKSIVECDAPPADNGCNCAQCQRKNRDRRGGGVKRESCLDHWLPRSNLPLPLLREQAEARGFTLPLPLGGSIIATVLERHVAVSDVRLGLGSNPPASIERVSVDEFDVVAVSQVGRVDLWLFPFLNVYGILGNTRSSGDLVVNVEEFPFPNSPPLELPIEVRLDGLTYGGGGTVAVGTKKVFATLDVNYSHTDFDVLASELFALVITPRIGLVIDRPCFKGEVHVGAMYQDTRQTVDVIINRPVLGEIHVEIDQFEPDPWNFLVGMLWGIDERLHAMVELGMGGRSYVISGLTVRF